MPGTLVITTLSDGTNSTSATNCIQGSAKAWVNFDGTGTVAIRASYNVSSITDLGTGVYRVNFSTALVDANYSVIGSNIGSVNTLFYTFIASNNVANSNTSCQFEAVHQSSSVNDQTSISIAVFR